MTKIDGNQPFALERQRMMMVLRQIAAMSIATVLTVLTGAIPVHGQTRFDDVRLVVDADEESADLERAILTSDPQGRRLRIEDRDGRVRVDASFDQLRALHFEESTYPPRLFARRAPYLTIQYVRPAGETAFAVVRLPGDSVAAMLDTLERDTRLAVDRSEPTASFLGLPLHLTPGYPVEVTDSTGRRVRGGVMSFSDTTIDLGTAGRFEASSIRRIDVIDPIRNGASTGAVVLGIPLFLVFWVNQDCEDACGGLPSLLGGVGIGALAGAFVDARTRRPAFRRADQGGSPRAEWTPFLHPKRKGVHVSLSF